MQLIILMAGKATRLAPLSYILPKGLMTINQKPACFNMIADLIRNVGEIEITFVVSPTNEGIVKDFAYKSFNNFKLSFVVQKNPQGPLHAFQLCKHLINQPTLLLLGDTLCETELDYSYDWIGYKTIDDNSHSRWCLIKTDAEENMLEIIDKPDYTPETNKALIGLYNFTDPQLLRQCLDKDYPKIRGELQLSSVINEYSRHRQIKGVRINSWYDTGTLRDYNRTLAENISGRSFNRFSLDELGMLTKTSSYDKLKTEIFWLKEINKNGFGFLAPAFYGDSIENKNGIETVSYKTEFVNGSTLSEYFNYYRINDDNWKYIFSRLLKTCSVMWRYKPDENIDIKKQARYMYIGKTLERIEKWTRKDILEKKYIYANGEKLLGFNAVFAKLGDRIEKLIADSEKFYSIIHGDICFSNIIYFPQTSMFKLLDPRGSFGVMSIYGDYRYDIAKLRHNYHGLYDYITLNLFKLKEVSADNFQYSFFTSEIINPHVFDDIIVQNRCIDIDDIELIEGLLFISMITLHNDNPAAQIMYYITGLKCLNNQLYKNKK